MTDISSYVEYFRTLAREHKEINDFYMMDINEPRFPFHAAECHLQLGDLDGAESGFYSARALAAGEREHGARPHWFTLCCDGSCWVGGCASVVDHGDGVAQGERAIAEGEEHALVSSKREPHRRGQQHMTHERGALGGQRAPVGEVALKEHRLDHRGVGERHQIERLATRSHERGSDRRRQERSAHLGVRAASAPVAHHAHREARLQGPSERHVLAVFSRGQVIAPLRGGSGHLKRSRRLIRVHFTPTWCR